MSPEVKHGRFMKTMTYSSPLPCKNVIILRTNDERQLDEIQLPHVQAVIYQPSDVPEWFGELTNAVQCGAFQVQRTLLDNVDYAEIEAWLEANLPKNVVSPAVRNALQRDVLSLVEWEHRSTRASRFIFRALTGTPSRHCGFHVDTVPPGAVPWGLLRVYNGAGTDYVEPDNVMTIRDFYRYLSGGNVSCEIGATRGQPETGWLTIVCSKGYVYSMKNVLS